VKTRCFIPPQEISFEFIRSSGPGGQNVNKVATAVQLRFNVRTSQSLAPEVRDRLIALAGKRIAQSGELIIEAKRFRSQQQNREDALNRLYQFVEKASVRPKSRRDTRPTKASKQRRLETKKRRSESKRLRSHRVSPDE
jgi:ribosome-associated protein